MIIDQISLLTRLPQEWGLNSRGLKRICSDSCSWTFGIQGENSMKSRDEIVIIMLQWMRLYTLGSRGSRELKTFLEIRLISSRIDQKLKNKAGKYMLLKGKLGPIVRPFDAIVRAILQVVGAIPWGDVVAFRSTWNERWFGFKLASKEATIAPRSSHDRAAIGPRSWFDRDRDPPWM